MLRKIKDQKGFTLVEVIVVAVIVLVLAAVAIPLYNGYIEDSRTNVANNLAGSVASGFGAALQQGNTPANTWITAATASASGKISIPNADATNAAANIITIPKGYTVTLNTTTMTVQASYTKGTKTFSSDTYNYGQP